MNAPLGLQTRFKVVVEALRFFGATTTQKALFEELSIPLSDWPRAFMRGEFLTVFEAQKDLRQNALRTAYYAPDRSSGARRLSDEIPTTRPAHRILE